MSRALDSLMKKKEFKKFKMSRGSPTINQLSFADGMIILCKAEAGTMKMVADTLDKYKRISGHKINKEKSVISLNHSVPEGDVVLAKVTTGILRKDFPFIYLGCPIFYKRKQRSYYNQMIQRISSKLQAWKGITILWGKGIIDQACSSEYSYSYSYSLYMSDEPSHQCFKPNPANDGTILLE